ncbi:MAG: hypothetical protein IKR19_08765 [Acholeplasmatales bacterium]|nr:hypothetical protein [Acholeplasmatales bacterium]
MHEKEKDIKKRKLYHRNKAKTHQSIMSRYKIRKLATLHSASRKHTTVALRYHIKKRATLASTIRHQNKYHDDSNISFRDAYINSIRRNAINGGAAPRMIIYRFMSEKNDLFSKIKNDWRDNNYEME